MLINSELLLNNICAYLDGNLTLICDIKKQLEQINNREEFIKRYLMNEDYYTTISCVKQLFEEIDSNDKRD